MPAPNIVSDTAPEYQTSNKALRQEVVRLRSQIETLEHCRAAALQREAELTQRIKELEIHLNPK